MTHGSGQSVVMTASAPARSRHILAALGARLRDAVAATDERLSLWPALRNAIHLPILRGMARRRAAALFDLCAGFVYTQVLTACVEADLFAVLRARTRTLDEIAAHAALPFDSAGRLIEAAVALRLMRRHRDGRYALGPLGAAVAADPGIAAMVAHHRLLYADLADPLAFLRGPAARGALRGFWPYEDAAPETAAPYTALMAASQAMVAQQVLATVSFAPYRALLDLGGGNGAFLRAIAARHPHLALALFDRPAVAREAERAFAAAGVAAAVHGGDFNALALPPGADLVSLIRVLHDHDDATVRALLGSLRRQMAPGAALLIAEPMADIPGAERVGNAYFPFYLRAMGHGRTRSPAEYRAFLHEAGFGPVQAPETPLPIVASVLLARL